MFEWLNPNMGWALAGILVPVLIHFLIRARAKPLPFSAIFFLKETIRKKNQRIRFSQLLLLLCRMALILFLALSMLKPVMKAPLSISSLGFLGSLRAETDWVIVVDNSLSMRMQEGKDTRFSMLKKQFRDFMDLLSEKDRVTILTTDGHFISKVFENVSLENAYAWEKNLKPGFGRSDLLTMVQRAEALLERSSRFEKKIVVFSDFQASEANSLRDHLKNKKNPIHTLLLASGKSVAAPPKNLALSSLKIPMLSPLEENRIPLEIKVAGFGKCHGTLQILQNGHWVSEVPLALDDKTEMSKIVLLESKRDADTIVEGRLSGDDFSEDNSFYALFRGPLVFNVLQIADKNFYIASALDPFVSQGIEGKTPFQLKSEALTDASLASADLVLVHDLLDLSEEELLRLEAFVYQGGALVTGFGNISNVADYEKSLSGVFRKEGGLLPGKLRQWIVKEGGDASITLVDEKKKELSKFRDPILWEQARVHKLMQLEAAPNTDVWLHAGTDPLLLLKSYGKGSVAWFMTKLEPEGTNLVLQEVFVPLVVTLMETLLASKKPSLFHTVGDRLRFHSDADRKDLFCLDPQGEPVEIFAEEKGDHAVLAENSGLYQVFEKERLLKTFAVNLPKEEADLEVLSAAEHNFAFTTAEMRLFLNQGENRIPLWRLCLWCVLGCLVLEIFLIGKLRSH
jgi:hypothetical protein